MMPFIDISASYCDNYFNDTEGTFTSPNYPQDYPNLSECHYYILGSMAENITINIFFSDFNLQQQFDYVIVRNIVNYHKFCKFSKASIQTLGNVYSCLRKLSQSSSYNGFIIAQS